MDDKLLAKTEATNPSIAQGRANLIDPALLECDVAGWRVTALGEQTGDDGKVWTVPASVNFASGPKATDLYNECNNVTLKSADALDLDEVPITEVDADGEVITVYFFGDNYSEIYINGKLIGVDPVPYWPFNTSVVRFRVERPFTAAVMMVDWEENLGLGSELMRGVPFHTGDGGFVAVFKDAVGETIAVTDETWRVQTYYVSPVADASCIEIDGQMRNSNNCAAPSKTDAENGYSAYWSLPEDWAQESFDEDGWRPASLYTNEDIGGSLQRPAFANFTDVFDNPEADAQFIWSSNLLLDNLVLARRSVE